MRAILFQENGMSYRPVHIRMKRYCLVVLKYHKKSLEKAALVREKFPNFSDKTKLRTQYFCQINKRAKRDIDQEFHVGLGVITAFTSVTFYRYIVTSYGH